MSADESTGSDGQLRASTSRGSSAPKSFRCNFQGCNMSFTRSEHLARHVRKHTGERPFQCHCGRSFSRLDNLRQHAITMHPDQPDENENMLERLAAQHSELAVSTAEAQRQQGMVVDQVSPSAGPTRRSTRRRQTRVSSRTKSEPKVSPTQELRNSSPLPSTQSAPSGESHRHATSQPYTASSGSSSRDHARLPSFAEREQPGSGLLRPDEIRTTTVSPLDMVTPMMTDRPTSESFQVSTFDPSNQGAPPTAEAPLSSFRPYTLDDFAVGAPPRGSYESGATYRHHSAGEQYPYSMRPPLPPKSHSLPMSSLPPVQSFDTYQHYQAYNYDSNQRQIWTETTTRTGPVLQSQLQHYSFPPMHQNSPPLPQQPSHWYSSRPGPPPPDYGPGQVVGFETALTPSDISPRRLGSIAKPVGQQPVLPPLGTTLDPSTAWSNFTYGGSWPAGSGAYGALGVSEQSAHQDSGSNLSWHHAGPTSAGFSQHDTDYSQHDTTTTQYTAAPSRNDHQPA